MKGPISNYLKALIDLVLPARCASCKKLSGDRVCAECLSKIEFIEGPCGGSGGGEVRDFDHAEAVCMYSDVMKELLHGFKFGGKKGLSPTLAAILARHLKDRPFGTDGIDLVVPVPLHKNRERERGFNQSALLATEISRQIKAPLLCGALIKSRDTRPQFTLKRKERLLNVQNAFEIIDGAAIKGKNILLVDDILTTGATAAECARELKNAGASGVFVLALCLAREE